MPSRNKPIGLPDPTINTALGLALKKASATTQWESEKHTADSTKQIILAAFDALRDLPKERELNGAFAEEKYRAIFDEPRKLIESLIPTNNKADPNTNCQKAWNDIVSALKILGVEAPPSIQPNIQDSFGVFGMLLSTLGFSNKNETDLFLFEAARNRDKDPTKIFECIRLLNNYKPKEVPLTIPWREEYRKKLEISEARTALSQEIQDGLAIRPYAGVPLLQKVTQMQTEFARIPSAIFDHITHPFFQKFIRLIELQNELGQISANITFYCNELLSWKTPVKSLAGRWSTKKGSRQNRISSSETVHNLAARRDHIEVQIKEYYGYTKEGILTEWKNRLSWEEIADFPALLLARDIAILQRLVADTREVREVLEWDILRPLIHQNTLYTQGVQILMEISDCQDTQKTAHEELEELLKTIAESNSLKELSVLRSSAVQLFNLLDSELIQSKKLAARFQTINLPRIIDSLIDEINTMA
jgi:hypothetical protein